MLSTYLEQSISVLLSGDIEITGVLKEAGSDCLVLSECQKVHRIPIRHIQQITFPDCQVEVQKFLHNGKTSFRKSLMNAKGRHVHVLLGKNTVLYGYIMSIMNNYFVFYSPIYKTIYISMDHVKSMTYDDMVSPYGQGKREFQPSKLALSRTFKEQMQRLIGQLVVIDLGDLPQKAGKLVGVEDGLVNLISADGNVSFLSIRHIHSFCVR